MSLPHRQWDVQSAELLGLFLEGKDPQLAFLPAAWCRRPVPLEKALPSLVWVIVYRPTPTPTCWLGWRYLAAAGGETEVNEKNKKKRLTTFLALEKWISHGQLLELSTWGWAGDGASGCWTSSWFCSALWGTMGLLPVDMTPILWPDGLCWDRAAFSRCRTTIKQSHKCSKSAVAETILKIKKS